jgi:uncharacterized protein with PIN domain/sulfur carrier protein ThiS
MSSVVVRFYGELGDFVDAARRGVAFECDLSTKRSVKDLIESLGVPHCEAFVVLVDGESVAFDRVIAGGERVAVYPEFSELDATGLVVAGAPSPTDGRFVLDGHLGRLAAYLRAGGFDVVHDRDAADDAIARVADDEDRVVLTRDVGLLKRSIVRHGRFVRATSPRRQLVEIVRRFRLADRVSPFTRCLRCNTPLVPATKDDARDVVPPRILARFDEFSRCPTCGRAFWRGTHHARIAAVVEATLAAVRDAR